MGRREDLVIGRDDAQLLTPGQKSDSLEDTSATLQ